MWECKFCLKYFNFTETSQKGNHSRWCNDNPKRNNTLNLKLAQEKINSRKLGEIKEFTVKCFLCEKQFFVFEREYKFPIKDKYYCSKKCSHTIGAIVRKNLYFIEDNLNYRKTCFMSHKHKCVVCNEEKILDVHHYDNNRLNNKKENLIPLCPTHHRYMHSEYKILIESLIDTYLNELFFTK